MRINTNHNPDDWNWRQHDQQRNNQPQTEEDMEKFRELQISVATSTFTVLTAMGLFCTCLYFGCCKYKKRRRVRNHRWNQDENVVSFSAVPPGSNSGYILDPNGLALNPYVIYGDQQQEQGGFYHLGTKDGLVNIGERNDQDNMNEYGNNNNNYESNTQLHYKSFFPKLSELEWIPPDKLEQHEDQFMGQSQTQKKDDKNEDETKDMKKKEETGNTGNDQTQKTKEDPKTPNNDLNNLNNPPYNPDFKG